MEIKQLKRFLAIVDEGSFASAASRLELTPQALSTVVANLEKDIGMRLFDRTRGGTTVLTQYGRALVPHARAQVRAERRALEELYALRDAGGGSVSVGIAEAFSRQVMAAAVARLHHEHPDIRIHLYEDYTEALLEKLWRGEVDFVAGSAGTPDAMSSTIIVEPLYSRNDVIVARKNHPLMQRDSLTLKDLQPYTWLVPAKREVEQQVIIDAFLSENLTPPDRFIWSDALSLGTYLLLREDYLIMTAPALIGQTGDHTLLQQLPIDRPTIRRVASLCYLDQTVFSPAVTTLIDAIRSLSTDVRGATPITDPRAANNEQQNNPSALH